MSRATIRARVQVTLDIAVGDSWGEDCPWSQVQKQARESAINALARLQRAHAPDAGMIVVGTPKVTAFIAAEES